MQTFSLDPRRWWIGRLFARNPLLRSSDRIEVLAILAAVVVSVVTIAVAGGVGAEVHDAERRADAEQARTHHLVTATITEVATATNFDGSEILVVRAAWADNGPHTDSFLWGNAVKAGDRIRIWVDDSGGHVYTPTPLRPVLDALTVASSIILVAVVLLTSMLELVHWRLQRARDAQWDREIRSLVEQGGGRANGPTPGKAP